MPLTKDFLPSDFKTILQWDDVLDRASDLFLEFVSIKTSPGDKSRCFTLTAPPLLPPLNLNDDTHSLSSSLPPRATESAPNIQQFVLFSDPPEILMYEDIAGQTLAMCRHCDKSFANRSNCRRHIKKHADTAIVFPCRANDCTYFSEQKANRDTHEKRFHKDMRFLKSRHEKGIAISRRHLKSASVIPLILNEKKKRLHSAFWAMGGIYP